MSNVGVIGGGQVGSTLGGKLLAKGFKVRYSSRDPTSAKSRQLLEKQPTATIDTVEGVIAASDVLILATPSYNDDASVQALAASLGPGIKGKVVIDATNPLTGWPGLEVRWGQPKSGGEVLAEALPGTYVFKAFNTVGTELMGDAERLMGEPITMLYAGPEEKKDVAAGVIEQVGFVPSYVGPIRYARNLEAIAELWIHLGVPGSGFSTENWGRTFHFQALRK